MDVIQCVKKRVAGSKGVQYSFKWAKIRSQHMSRNQSLLRYGRCSCDLYSRCCMWFPCLSMQPSAFHCTQLHTVKIPSFTESPDRNSVLVALILRRHWWVLNTPKSLGVPTAK
jgi:hypothetical protein